MSITDDRSRSFGLRIGSPRRCTCVSQHDSVCRLVENVFLRFGCVRPCPADHNRFQTVSDLSTLDVDLCCKKLIGQC